ncbi:thiazole tautomerase (transcriptional regulator TenI) [Metabacillus crassostreae]|uniref:thiazole tautomerase TenI n=1 Tax=Metabacillus crassostreae TaxID=929098 RepID=UPI00195B7AB0|nr:thiazole tautomerase TenI [Metabacillus crassostreae]MBM7604049.1 thiazole tautomerase (transcriptional regulator TenI) [Metabacillus crassostreae]
MEIHVITDGKQSIDDLVKRIMICHEKVDYIHIRERNKTASELMDIVSKLITLGVPKEKLVINDRLDVAILNHTPNVHLPGHSFSIEDVKRFNSTLRVGSSVHSVEEALICEKAGADYVIFGHIFETNSKQNLAPRGVKQLREILEKIEIPVIAIGGIDPSNISELKGLKLKGIAVMSYVMQSDDPNTALKKLRKSIAKG